MKDYKVLSSRYLKIQKRRTILTIIGIILSAALISGVQIIYASFMDYQERNARANANYHGNFISVDYDKAVKIKNNVNVVNATFMRDEGITFIWSGDKNTGRSFIKKEDAFELSEENRRAVQRFRVKGLEAEGFERFSIEIVEGRLPESDNEIVLRGRTVKSLNGVKIGDSIEILHGALLDESGKEVTEDNELSASKFVPVKSKSYKLVGIVTDNSIYSWSTTELAFTALKGDLKGSYNVFIDVKKPRNTYKVVEEIGKSIGLTKAEDYRFRGNNRLLRFYGAGQNAAENLTLIMLIALITGIIVISTVAVINNSFNISIIEKSSEYGMLRAIGASPGQIRGLVLREASLMSLIGIPLGILGGFGGMQLLFSIFGMLNFKILNQLDLRIILKPSIFIVSILVSAITVYISAAIPAKRAAGVSPIEALKRVDRNIKIKKSKQSRLFRALFGTEGEIAYKNLSRSRKRFVITVFSLALSVTLYIGFDSLVNQVVYVTKGELDKYSYSIGVKDIEKSKGILNEIKKMDNVERATSRSANTVVSIVPEEKIIKENVWFGESDKQTDSLVLSNTMIMVTDREYLKSLKDHLLQGQIDESELDKGGVLLLQKNLKWHDNIKEYLDYTSFKAGDTIAFSEIPRDEGDWNENIKKAERIHERVVALLNDLPVFNEYPQEGLIMITTEEGLQKLNLKPEGTTIFVTKKPNTDGSRIVKYLEDLQKKGEVSYFYNYEARAEEDKQMLITLGILIYGFITLIILISSVNIFNTISSNLFIRKKELGVIKSVGMSQSSLRKMIYLEGFYYGLFAIIYGGIAGTGLAYLFYMIFGISQNVRWAVNLRSYVIVAVGVMAITALSTYLPLKKLDNVSIIESIRTEE